MLLLFYQNCLSSQLKNTEYLGLAEKVTQEEHKDE
jgi:hypothetical protein